MAGVFKVELGYVDSSNETSKVAIYTSSLLNLVSGTFPPALTAFELALGTLSNLTLISKRSESKQAVAPVAYGSGTGNREDKWLVHYHDTTSEEKKSFSIPCRFPTSDFTMILGTDFMDPADPAWTALRDAMAAASFMVSNTGGAVALDAIQLVGRNL